MATIPEVPSTGFGLYLISPGRTFTCCSTTWLSARLVSRDLTGTGHSEIVVDLEVSWLSDRSHHVGLVSLLFAPPC